CEADMGTDQTTPFSIRGGLQALLMQPGNEGGIVEGRVRDQRRGGKGRGSDACKAGSGHEGEECLVGHLSVPFVLNTPEMRTRPKMTKVDRVNIAFFKSASGVQMFSHMPGQTIRSL